MRIKKSVSYRYRIRQQKIGVSVSAENGVLGLTLLKMQSAVRLTAEYIYYYIYYLYCLFHVQ